MTIGRKIALGFLCLIALATASGLYQLHLVNLMQEQSRRLVEVDYQAGATAQQLRNWLFEVDNFTSKYFVLRDPEDYAAALEERMVGISGELDRVQELSLAPADRVAYEEFQRRWDGFRSELSPLLERSARVDAGTFAQLQGRLGELLEQSLQVVRTTQATSRAAVRQSQATSDTARTVAGASAALALLLALALTWLIVRSITRPLDRLLTGTERLASGDLAFRVEEQASGELGELSRYFNRMARRLEELDQLKKDFVSHVSHDLKAPLASIQETTSLLLEQIPGPLSGKQQRLLQLNLNCSRRLSAMINNLLDLSRLEGGVAEYEFQSADLGSLVEAVVAEVEPLAQDKNCSFRVDLDSGRLGARCDASRLMQVIRNLLDNAVNFSPEGAAIEVGARRLEQPPDDLPAEARQQLVHWDGEEYLELRVSDLGPGVAEAHKARIFEKFHQVKRGGKLRGQGVGLGLAICRSIVQAHGGTIWVRDNPPGGSTFSVLLPCSGPQRVPPPSFSTLE